MMDYLEQERLNNLIKEYSKDILYTLESEELIQVIKESVKLLKGDVKEADDETEEGYNENIMLILKELEKVFEERQKYIEGVRYEK